MKELHLFLLSSFVAIFFISCSQDDILSSHEDESGTRSNLRTIYYSLSMISNSVPLSSADQVVINNFFDDMQGYGYSSIIPGTTQMGDGYNPLFYRLSQKKLAQITRGSTSSAAAVYNVSTNSIILRTGTTITQEALTEELIHAAQDRIYSGGIGQYANTKGTPNIEFEAKIIQEILNCINGRSFGNLGQGPTHSDEYIRWILTLTPNDTFPTMWKVLGTTYGNYGYYDFMDFFKVKDSGYNKPTIYNMDPQTINYVSNNYGRF